MNKVVAYQLLDNEQIVLYITKDKKLRVDKVYNTTRNGILCNDLTTFIDYSTAQRTDFTD